MKMNSQNLSHVIACFILCLLNPSAFAGLMADSTRIIYPASKTELTVMLNNTNEYPVLSQVWVDDGQGEPDLATAPFLVLAPMFRLQAHESRSIRLVLTDQAKLPQDKESLFWLNLYEIPQVKAKDLTRNHLNVSMNTQLKLIYRPHLLSAPNITALNRSLRLSFNRSTQKKMSLLKIENPTKHYVSMVNLKATAHQNTISLSPSYLTLAPMQSETIEINTPMLDQLNYELIDDQGIYHPFQYQF